MVSIWSYLKMTSVQFAKKAIQQKNSPSREDCLYIYSWLKLIKTHGKPENKSKELLPYLCHKLSRLSDYVEH